MNRKAGKWLIAKTCATIMVMIIGVVLFIWLWASHTSGLYGYAMKDASIRSVYHEKDIAVNGVSCDEIQYSISKRAERDYGGVKALDFYDLNVVCESASRIYIFWERKENVEPSWINDARYPKLCLIRIDIDEENHKVYTL